MVVRDVLAHDFDIDLEEIHKVCDPDIPQLKRMLQRMLEAVS